MSFNTRSEFVDFVVPLRDRLKLYDRAKPPQEQPGNDSADVTKAIPQGFIDAMVVREEVFVKEQKIPLENELDEDDAKSFHWVAYASVPSQQPPVEETSTHGKVDPKRRISTSTKIPIGTIRLVPPPHPPHPLPDTHHKADALDVDPTSRKDSTTSTHHDGLETYIKLGRLAIIPEFRKAGISKLLIETALAFAREHPDDVSPHKDPTKVEALRQEISRGGAGVVDWDGLVLVHAQTGVQRLWRKFGFEVDEGMGSWDEEGIEHVGMWRRVDVSAGRRKSVPWGLPVSP